MPASCLGRVFVRFCRELWQQVPEWKNALARGDWPAIEAGILKLTRLMATEIMAGCLLWYLEREDTRHLGKKLAEKRGIKTQGTRNVHVTLATGRRLLVRTTPDVEKELAYFERHRDRIRYKYYRRKKIPIGSGAVESAIRRMINLRMKAPGTFWKEDTAEIFLYLRSQLISGRWDLCFKSET